jgi:CBS domain-containing membrane protein
VIDAGRKLMGLLRLDDALKSDPSLPAGQIMRQTFARVKVGDSATELLHILAKGDRRHVMVVDDEGRLEGMVSKSDLMRALFHAS